MVQVILFFLDYFFVLQKSNLNKSPKNDDHLQEKLAQHNSVTGDVVGGKIKRFIFSMEVGKYWKRWV